MSKNMAMSAAEDIAKAMGRTFMEFVKTPKGYMPRKGTVLLTKASGNKYEIKIQGAKLGQYSYPFVYAGNTFTAGELNKFRQFLRELNFYKAKRKMNRLKGSKKGV